MPEATFTVVLTATAGLVPLVLQAMNLTAYSNPLDFVIDLVAYGSMLVIVLFASHRRGLHRLSRDFGFSFHRIDLAIGAGLALGNVLYISIVTGVLHNSGAMPPPIPADQRPLIYVVLLQGVVAVAIAPLIEELVTRGLLMRSIRHSILRRHAKSARSARIAINASIISSAAIFAALHLHEADNPLAAVSIGVQTFIFGLVAGWIATRTGRLGPTIVAHTLYNAFVFAIAFSART
ncbi:hypothetical protein GCM10011399_35610 [Subtercola lobariae]|uniref:CAAX prenyl protease 2/Lysostaphin resistance protein A-like domain-containing protein n=1 Tax=Subtercola lobariae TaxID=1588641 RepID=A0A917BEK2_9MICO|nr:hypothetical protein GCM10011399_35610 [Subtercola lobariae]